MSEIRGILGKISTCIVLVLGVPCLILVLWVGIDLWLHGDVETRVVAPLEQGASVVLDGSPLAELAPGEAGQFDLPQGIRAMVITLADGTTTEHTLELDSGFTELLVPASADQCFLELDVTKFYYEVGKSKDGLRPLPTVERRIHGGDPVEITATTFTDEAELPDEISEHSTVAMLFQLPCATLHAPDHKLIHDVLGYEGWEKKGLFGRD